MNTANIAYINKSIREMLQQQQEIETPFVTNHRAIKGAFTCGSKHCENAITKDSIYRQLALIDTFYSTNVHRMRQFGLEEMRDEILDLCRTSSTSTPTLGCLSGKLTATLPLNPQTKSAFYKPYGYITPSKQAIAPSLLSKYFYFVSIVCPMDDWGFPIYDSIVRGLLRKLQRFIGIPLTAEHLINQSSKTFDIDKYIDGLKRIIDALQAGDSALWNSSGWQKFVLLDYFLWHIGKAHSKSHSYLLTKKEYLNEITPPRVKAWAATYDHIENFITFDKVWNQFKKEELDICLPKVGNSDWLPKMCYIVPSQMDFLQRMKEECTSQGKTLCYIDCRTVRTRSMAANFIKNLFGSGYQEGIFEPAHIADSAVVIIDNITEIPDIPERELIANILIHSWKEELCSIDNGVIDFRKYLIYLIQRPEEEAKDPWPVWRASDGIGWGGNILELLETNI